jgi:hypothetical protein
MRRGMGAGEQRKSMPTRIVREGINTSELINSLSDSAELFYRRLMSVADDYGRFWADPSILRGAVFPLKLHLWSKKRVNLALRECVSKQTVFVYGNGIYLAMPKFGQQVRSKSKFPEPPPELLQSGCTANSQAIANQAQSKCVANPNSETKTQTKTQTKTIASPPVPAPPVEYQLRPPEPPATLVGAVKALVEQTARQVAPPQSELSGDKLADMKSLLCNLYRRPISQRWGYAEECLLAEIVRRDDPVGELQTILQFRKRLPMDKREFFPGSLPALLEKWNATLDRARMSEPRTPKVPRPLPMPQVTAPLDDAARARMAEKLKSLRESIENSPVPPLPDTGNPS